MDHDIEAIIGNAYSEQEGSARKRQFSKTLIIPKPEKKKTRKIAITNSLVLRDQSIKKRYLAN